MDGMSWAADTVLMPVSLRYAQLVADYLADLKAGGVPAVTDRVVETVTVPGQGEWTQTMVKTLVESTPYAGVLALLDRCAGAGGAWVIKSDIEDAQGISAIQLRNELGALSKLTKKLFRDGQGIWPMHWKKERGSYYYRMDPTMASWWAAARSSS